MNWYSETAGLTSSSQYIDYTPIAALNIDTTEDSLPELHYEEELPTEPTLIKKLSDSKVKIRIRPEDNEEAFYMLLHAEFVQCFPDNIYIVPHGILADLDRADIVYQRVND